MGSNNTTDDAASSTALTRILPFTAMADDLVQIKADVQKRLEDQRLSKKGSTNGNGKGKQRQQEQAEGPLAQDAQPPVNDSLAGDALAAAIQVLVPKNGSPAGSLQDERDKTTAFELLALAVQ